jgi:hypothetical protein
VNFYFLEGGVGLVPKRPSATLSTTKPTWIDPGANPGIRGERPATNDLSHGTARICELVPTKEINNSDNVLETDRRFRRVFCLMMEAGSTSETFVSNFLPDYKVHHPRRQLSSYSLS